MKRFYLVRHGQTEANAQHYVPSKEEPLNEVGFFQASQLAERVANLDVQKLVVSDFLRAQQTISPIVDLKKLEPEVVPAFGEVLEPSSLYGVSDADDRVVAYKAERNSNVENSQWSFEDGEPFHSVHKRINQAREYLESLENENTLIVAHAFFLQCFTAAVLLGTTQPTKDFFNVAKTLRISNTGISLFTFDEGVWRVVMINDHAHFAE